MLQKSLEIFGDFVYNYNIKILQKYDKSLPTPKINQNFLKLYVRGTPARRASVKSKNRPRGYKLITKRY